MKARIKYYATYFCARECSLYNFIRFKAEFEVLIMNQAKQCHISQKKNIIKPLKLFFLNENYFPLKVCKIAAVISRNAFRKKVFGEISMLKKLCGNRFCLDIPPRYVRTINGIL